MYYKLTYTDKLPDGTGGQAWLWFVKIRPKYKDDRGIHAHELYHVSEFWKNPLYPILYTWSKSYRLQSEVNAYREQLKYYPDDRTNLFAKFIVEDYNLDVEQESIIQLLKEREE